MASSKKYEFTGEAKQHEGIDLHRIRAVKDIPEKGVKAGDLGGWIQSEKNLSHKGSCWVSDEAWVFGEARIIGNALISGNAWVFGYAEISDYAQVSGDAWAAGYVHISGHANVTGGSFTSGSINR